nr:MAG TPA: hypothetical protein [Bacteriophage sp.]
MSDNNINTISYSLKNYINLIVKTVVNIYLLTIVFI